MTHAAIETSGTRHWLYRPGASFNGIYRNRHFAAGSNGLNAASGSAA